MLGEKTSEQKNYPFYVIQLNKASIDKISIYMKHYFILLLFGCIGFSVTAQTSLKKNKLNTLESAQPALVDFDAYLKLAEEVNTYRQNHLIPLDTFLKWSRQPNVIILDTRSDSMYNAKHIKDAIHLNFSDFTQRNLMKLIPDPETKILIYCNNNIADDQVYFATKAYTPPSKMRRKPLTLALNIPTYINLYGYGYRNVYELSELVSIFNGKVLFEGTIIH
jgi:hypothetical protein